jgi:hypothetical protein
MESVCQLLYTMLLQLLLWPLLVVVGVLQVLGCYWFMQVGEHGGCTQVVVQMVPSLW